MLGIEEGKIVLIYLVKCLLSCIIDLREIECIYSKTLLWYSQHCETGWLFLFMPVDYYPDTTEYKYIRQHGEFSIKTEEAFKNHLKRMQIQREFKIYEEPWWYCSVPEFMDSRR